MKGALYVLGSKAPQNLAILDWVRFSFLPILRFRTLTFPPFAALRPSVHPRHARLPAPRASVGAKPHQDHHARLHHPLRRTVDEEGFDRYGDVEQER